MEKISSDAIDEKSENKNMCLGFPQLQTCGGLELLKCRQNCRELKVVDCEWNARTLKTFLGNQAKIYVRPIQRSLSTDLVNEHNEQEHSKVNCRHCRKMLSVRELREHLHTCESRANLISDSEDELPDPHLTQDFPNKKCDFKEVLDQKTFLRVKDFVNDMSTDCPEQLRPGLLTIPEDTSSCNLSVDGSAVQTESKETVIENITTAENDSEGTTSDTCGGPMDFVIAKAIDFCISENIQDPVEILRYLQSVIVCGRQLEITDTTQCDEGETNFIIVDRNNILETGFEEVSSIENLRKTLEVQFYDETAIDQGGPRKEFFSLILSAIKEKYFDKGLRDYMHADYTVIGKIIGLSILQNGPVPKFLDENILNRLFLNSNSEDFESACVHNLKKGLDCLGLIKVGSVLPMFRHLFRPSCCTLTIKALIQLLRPKFSEEGSNNKRYESAVYTVFLKYLRAVASGRRGTVSLRDVLQFATGANEEPVLGFVLHPSIEFVESTPSTSFIPTASTCTNTLNIPRPSAEIPLPPEENLFSYYDYAFSNAYFGLM
ncbi:uncharacterized protein LOC133176276 [Saccostrea echinata]|uniref:uncharacterized protein LOC133176276 n=1 Tax=Saccostrea echinata TaxID=191078 RepID=UPI002A80E468|nr:uncharacterized protein LOC133176276 [Saccostrea echinata]